MCSAINLSILTDTPSKPAAVLSFSLFIMVKISSCVMFILKLLSKDFLTFSFSIFNVEGGIFLTRL